MFLLLLVLIHGFQHASGEEVTVVKGAESVLLPFWVNVSVSSGSTVVWNRMDLQPSMIHVHRPAGDYLTGQNQQYNKRTSMKENALQTGDLSLTLRKPTYTDSGTYSCMVNRGGTLSETEVHLYVREPPPPPVWPYVVLLLIVLMLLIVVGFCYYKRKTTALEKKLADQQLNKVETTEGEESVTLPFILQDLHDGETVELRHANSNKLVWKFEKGQEQVGDQQHPDYKGRVKVNKDPQRTGYFSLTLQNPRWDDGGTYIWNISKAGNIIRQDAAGLVFKRTKRARAASSVETSRPDSSDVPLMSPPCSQ